MHLLIVKFVNSAHPFIFVSRAAGLNKEKKPVPEKEINLPSFHNNS
jgi:hypothetical protein